MRRSLESVCEIGSIDRMTGKGQPCIRVAGKSGCSSGNWEALVFPVRSDHMVDP